MFEFIDTKYAEIPAKIKSTKQLDEEAENALVKAITEFKKEFK